MFGILGALRPGHVSSLTSSLRSSRSSLPSLMSVRGSDDMTEIMNRLNRQGNDDHAIEAKAGSGKRSWKELANSLVKSGSRIMYGTSTDSEVLERLHIVNGDNVPVMAGLLTVGKYPQQFSPSYSLMWPYTLPSRNRRRRHVLWIGSIVTGHFPLLWRMPSKLCFATCELERGHAP